jgi:hypothetical protein
VVDYVGLCCDVVFATLGGETVFCTLGGATLSTLLVAGITTFDFCRVAPLKISAKRFKANLCLSPTLKMVPLVAGVTGHELVLLLL